MRGRLNRNKQSKGNASLFVLAIITILISAAFVYAENVNFTIPIVDAPEDTPLEIPAPIEEPTGDLGSGTTEEEPDLYIPPVIIEEPEVSMFSISDTDLNQGKAEIGKPVKWRKRVNLESAATNVRIELPREAKNIEVTRIVGDEQFTVQNVIVECKVLDAPASETEESSPELSIPAPIEESESGSEPTESDTDTPGSDAEEPQLSIPPVIVEEPETPEEPVEDPEPTEEPVVEDPAPTDTPSDNSDEDEEELETEEVLEILILEEVKDFIIEYETPAPLATEASISNYKKQVTVSSDFHYTNVLTYAFLPIEVNAENADAINLYWINGADREKVEFEVSDADGNGKLDYIEWITPHLSSQTFEIEIRVINVQSYPMVGGKWTVEFETVGQADLIITAFNGTTWNNDPDNTVDLNFLEIKCGSEVLNYQWTAGAVVITDYTCNASGFEVSDVITPGSHHLEFDFGGLKAYAHNYAWEIINKTGFDEGNYSGTQFVDSFELPDNEGSNDWIDMTDNVLLLHMSGSVIDSGSNAHHGVAQGGAHLVEGKIGLGAGNFTNGAAGSQAVRIPHSEDFNFGANNFTLSCWMKTSDDAAWFLSSYDGVGATSGWEFGYHTVSGGLIFATGGAGNSIKCAAINDNNWHHILVVRNGTTGRLFVDGVLKSSENDWTSIDTDNLGIRIGGDINLPARYDGLIDEFAIYHRALSNAEIVALNNSYSHTGSETGLVSVWHFDEYNTEDSSSNNNHGNTENGVSLERYGKLNGAYEFDGDDDHVRIPYDEISGEMNFTINVWAYPAAPDGGQIPTIIAQDKVPSSTARFFFLSYGSIYGWHFWNTGETPFSASILDIPINQWSMLTATYNRTNIITYVNGAQDRVIAASGPWTSTSDLTIGSGYQLNSDRFFNGAIDEAAIYNRSLSAAEVSNLYNSSRGYIHTGSETGLVSVWHLDEIGAGWNIEDTSLWDHHGAVNGSNYHTSGKLAGAMEFDGVDDYIEIADSDYWDLDGPGNDSDFTINAWVNIDDFSATSLIFGQGSTGGHHAYFGVFATGAVQFRTVGIIDNLISAAGVVTNNTWHLISVTKAGDTFRLYVNGDRVANKTDSSAGYPNYNGPIGVGAAVYLNPGVSLFNPTDGKIDEFAIWKRALSQQELAVIYETQRLNAPHVRLQVWNGTEQGLPANQINDGTFDMHKNVLLMHMDDKVEDSGPNHNHGVAQYGATTIGGKIGNAGGYFDGVDDYVAVQDSAELSFGDGSNDRPFSISAWINADSTSDKIIAAKWGGTKNEWFFGFDGTAHLIMAFQDESTAKDQQRRTTAAQGSLEGSWHHVVMTYNGSGGANAADGVKFYIDGVENASSTSLADGSYVAMEDQDNPVQLGGISGHYFIGHIDELAIYDHVLTADEAAVLYNSGTGYSHTGSEAGLVSVWHLDEMPSAEDSSSNNNHGREIGGVTPKTQGKLSGAYEFDGVDDYVDVGDTLHLTSSGITVEAWVNLKKLNQMPIVAKENEYLFWSLDGSGFCFYVYGGATWQPSACSSLTPAPNLNTWYHVVSSWNTTHLKLYVNGTLENTTARSTAPSPTANSLYIGQRADSYFLNGSMDEVAIWNRSLSDVEVAARYNSGNGLALTGSETGLVSVWHMDALNPGWLIGDSSGKAHHGNATDDVLYDANGQVGSALEFDGSDDYIEIADSDALDITNSITISTWIKSDDVTKQQVIISKNDAGGDDGFFMHVTAVGAAEFRYWGGEGEAIAYTPTYTILNNNWYHLVGRFDDDSNTHEIYVNGVLSGTGAGTKTMATNNESLRIGRQPGGNFFDGSIDEVAIWGRALSVAEIEKLYQRGHGKFGGGAGGNYTSKVFQANASTPWYNLSWVGTEPKLPDNQAVETYLGGANMTGNVLLLHMDVSPIGAVKDSADNHEGTAYDGADTTASGKLGRAGEFDGVNDYVAIPDSSDWNFGADNFTISSWFYLSDLNGSKTLYSQYGSLTKWMSLYLHHTTNNFYFTYRNEGGGADAVYKNWKPAWEFNTWHNIVLVRNGTHVNMYFDGEFVIPNATTTEVGSNVLANITGSFDLGWNEHISYKDWYLNGSLDEVAIYNTALSAAEILNLNNSYVHTGSENGLVSVWHMDEAGWGAGDTSGSENSGYVNVSNGPVWTTDSQIGDGAFEFDGDDDHIELSKTILYGLSDYSISYWAKCNASSTNYIYSENDTSDGNAYAISTDNEGIWIKGCNGCGEELTVNNIGLGDDKWHNVVLTYYNSIEAKVYVDGELKHTDSSVNLTWDKGDPGVIGDRAYDGSAWGGYEGAIDEFAIWNRSLSNEEVKDLYRRGVTKLKLNVRTCDDYLCAADDWFGPYGNSNELPNYNADMQSTFNNPLDVNMNGNVILMHMNDIVEDSTRNKHHGLQNSVVESTIGRIGTRAAKFDGAYPAITVKPSGDFDFGTQDFSASIWVNISSGIVIGDGESRFLHKYGGWGVSLKNDGRFYSNIEDLTIYQTGAQDYRDDTWHHIVLVREGDDATIYIDGTNSNTDPGFAAKVASAPGANLWIGESDAQGSDNVGYEGYIDEVAIYSKALSPAEVVALNNSYVHTGNEEDLVAVWHLDEEFIEGVEDSSPNNNHGLPQNGVLSDPNGRLNGAYVFDGVDDFVSTTSMGTISGDFMFSGWIKTTHNNTWPSGEHADFIHILNASNAAMFRVYIQQNSLDAVIQQWEPGSDIFSTATTTLVGDAQWHHLAVGRNGSNFVIYVDGVLEVNDPSAASTVYEDLVIKMGSLAGQFLNGTIDEVALYNRTLNAAEVLVLNNFYIHTGSETGLVAVWHLDELGAGSKIRDSSGYSHHGNVTNDVLANPDGKLSTALEFDGDLNNYITIPDPEISGNDSFTLSAWVNAKDLSGAHVYGMGIMASTDSEIIGDFALSVNNDGAVHFWNWRNAGADADGIAYTADNIVEENKWYHIIATWDGSTNKIYVNGADQGSLSTKTTTGLQDRHEIGRIYHAEVYTWNGTLDEIAIWKRALSQSEILNIYNKQVRNYYTESPADFSFIPQEQYYQYYFDFETDDSDPTPVLYNVTVESYRGESSQTTINLMSPGNTYVESIVHTIVFQYNITDIQGTLSGCSVYLNSVQNTSNSTSVALGMNNITISDLADIAHSWKVECGGDAGGASSQTWTLTMSAPAHACASGLCRDWTQKSFEAATLTQVYYDWQDVRGNELNSSFYNGTIISRVHDATYVSNWKNMSWKEDIPYQEELPGSGTDQKGRMGGANMTGNVLLFHMNEEGGLLQDASGESNHASTSNALTYNQSGKFNYAIDLDGSSSYIHVTDPASGALDFGASDSFTISTWVKTEQTADNYLVWKVLPGASMKGYQLLQSNGNIKFNVINYTASTEWDVTGQTINDGEWHHIVAVRDAGSNELRIYTDNKKNTSTDGSADLANWGNLVIGRKDLPVCCNNYWNGTLDEFAMWNRSLSDTEVAELYQRGSVNVKFLVRSCDDAQCDDNPEWLGPYGTGALPDNQQAGAGTSPATPDMTGNVFLAHMTAPVRDSFDSHQGVAQNGAHTVSGKIGYGAGGFDGVGDIVTVAGDDLVLGSNNFTFSAWVYSTGDETDQLILGKRNVSPTRSAYLKLDGSKRLQFYLNDGSECVDQEGTSFPGDQWVHVIFMRNGTTYSLYRDGNLVKNKTCLSTGSSFDGPDFEIGGLTNSPATYGWNGSIDEVAFYNKTLSSAEISALYNSGTGYSHTGEETGLAAVWHMDEYSVPDGADSNHAHIINEVHLNDTGKLSKAYDLDGVNDYVMLPDSETFNFADDDFTISTWINYRNSGDQQIYTQSGGAGDIIIFDLTAADQLALNAREIAGAPWDISMLSNITMNTNQWYHVMAMREGNDWKLYINGSLVNITTQTLTLSNSAYTPIIGATANGTYENYFFDGMMDEFAVYDRALNTTEISTVYNSGNGYVHTGSESGLATVYHMDELDAGWKVGDTSGRDNHGDSYNGTIYTSGQVNGAMEFDNNSRTYIEIPHQSDFDFGTNDFTLMAWVKENGDHTGMGNRIFGKGDTSGWKGYGMEIGLTNKIRFHIAGTNPNYNTTLSDSTVYRGGDKWMFVVGLRESGVLKIYVDGVLAGTGTPPGAIDVSGTYPITIGRVNNNWDNFDGAIDEVAIWNRSLSAKEILDIYTRQGENYFENSTLSDIDHIPNNRFLQYKAFFETDNTTYTPELYNVSMYYTQVAPVISLVTPLNQDTWGSSHNITFTYQVTNGDTTPLANCRLILNGAINDTDTSITKDIDQQFNVTGLANGDHTWAVNCTDTNGFSSISSTWNVHMRADDPVVTLNSQIDAYNSSLAQVNFTCSITDDRSLVNVSLWGNWSGGWHLNETQNISGTSDSVLFTKTINPDEHYIWNCQAYDTDELSAFASSNRTITVDTTNPVTALASPLDTWTETTSHTILFKYTVTDVTTAIQNCSLVINDSIVDSQYNVPEGPQQTFTRDLLNGAYNWSVQCYDTVAWNHTATTRTLTLGVNAPLVVLNAPIENANSTYLTQTFNCTAHDDIGLVNMTLWSNWSGTWQQENYSTLVGTEDSAEFIHVLPDYGSYMWNCLAYDNNAPPFSDWGVNRTLTLENTTPNIVWVDANPFVLYQNETTNITASVTDNLAVGPVWVQIDNTNYTLAATGGIWKYVYNVTSLAPGTHVYTVYANDSASNPASPMQGNFTVNVLNSPGGAQVIITYPLDNNNNQMKFDNFYTNATVTAVGGNVTGCNATIAYSNGTVLSLGSGSATQTVGDLLTGQSSNVQWNTSASEEGYSNITVQTVCTSGVGDSDSSYNIQIIPYTQVPPVLDAVTLASTNPVTNYTHENLTISLVNLSDRNGDSLTNITDWRVGGASIAVLNMPFDTNYSNHSVANVTRDYSTFSNNGTGGNGDPSKTPTWNAAGKVGGAYKFDGDDDYIRIPHDESINFGNTDEFSIALWFKTNDSGASYPRLISKFSDAAHRCSILLWANTSLVFEIASERVYTPSVNDSEWHHVVATYNITHMSLHLDNLPAQSISVSLGDFSNSNPLYISSHEGGGGSTLDGLIDEVKIYNRSLSAEQIHQLYLEGNNSASPKIVSQETSIGDVWTAAVTPNDGYADGNTTISNSVTILGDQNPNILWIDADPFVVTQNQNVNITSWVTDDISLASVQVQIAGTNYTMTQNGNVFNYTRNATAAAGTQTFTVFATDNSGLISSKAGNYTITTGAATGDLYPWPMFHHDLENTGYTTADGPENISILTGSFDTGNRVYSSPAVANGYVYAGTFDGWVYQLNASNVSQQIANFSIGGAVYSSPAVSGGFVYISDSGGPVFQLNASNISQEIANYSNIGSIESSPTVSGGFVYIGSDDNNIYQLNASNVSQQIANFSTDDNVRSIPAVSGGYVYIGSYDNNVYQLNASNISQKIANFSTGSSVLSSPAVSGGFVYIGSTDYQVYQLNASNISQKIANFSTGDSIYASSPAVAGGFVYIGSQDDQIYQLNASNISQKIANFSAGDDIHSSPAISNGAMYIGSKEGNLYMFGNYTLAGVVGGAQVDITTPADYDKKNNGTTFTTSATITAVSGDVIGCSATISFSSAVLSLASGTATQTVGSLTSGQSSTKQWSVSANSVGFANITVSTSCTNGTADSDTVYYVNVTTADFTNPVIQWVDANPFIVIQNQSTNITARITDDINVNSSLVQINGVNYSMTQAGEIWYRYHDTTGLAANSYTFTVYGSDSAGNSDSSSGTFNVTLPGQPGGAQVLLTTPSDDASYVQGVNITTSATITAVSGDVANCNATISFSSATIGLAGGETATHVLGSLTSGQSNVTQWNVVGASAGSANIFVNTTCQSGQGDSDGAYNITIQADTQGPTILWVDADPFVVMQNQTTNLTARVSDNSVIDTVQVTVNSVTYAMTQNGFIWNNTYNTSALAANNYTYTVFANDTNGNSATKTGNFTVTTGAGGSFDAYPWPMSRRNLENTAYTLADAPDDISSSSAEFTTGLQVFSSAAIVNGFVYVGSLDSNLYQLNASNITQQIANFTTGGNVASSPAISGGFVYVGSVDGKLYQLNASNVSQKIANFSGSAGISSSPAVSEGFVYIGSSGVSGQVYQLNASNVSQKIANFSSGSTGQTTPAVANGFVYVSSSPGGLFQLNASNVSKEIASFSEAAITYSSPAVSGGFVYVGTSNNHVYQLNASNVSQKIANFSTGSFVLSSPAVANGFVYVGSNDNNFYQLNASNISIEFARYTAAGPVSGGATVADGYVFVGSDDNKVYQLNASNVSKKIQEFATGGDVIATPAVSNGVLYIGSSDSKVYAFGTYSLSATGGAQVTITSPADYEAKNNGTYFTTDATITAVGGGVSDCTATLSIAGSSVSLASGETAANSIGTLSSGQSTNTQWNLSADSIGLSNLTVSTSCTIGTADSETVYFINVSVLDVTNPTIVWVDANPFVVNQNQTTSLTARVTDNAAVSSAWVQVAGTNYSMTQNADVWNYTRNATSAPGLQTFTVFANDTSGNLASDSGTFNITLPTQPGGAQVVITTPADDAAYSAGSPITATATITAVSGDVANCNATISFSDESIVNLTGAETYTHVLGSLTSGQSNITSWSLSANAAGSSNIFVNTTCQSGSGDSDGAYNITVTSDSQDPAILWVDANPIVVEQNQTVNLTAQITDNSAVQAALLQVSGTNYSMTQNGVIFNYTHNATEAVGTHIFTVFANDSSGNSATRNGNFTVIITGSPGGAQVVITSPADDATQSNGSSFTATANITAVSGDVANCNATISFTNENIINITGAETYVHVLGSLTTGQSNISQWNLDAKVVGSSNISVATACTSGTGDVDSVYNITVTSAAAVPAAPTVFNSSMGADNQSIVLGWSQVSGITGYYIYYSDNLTWIMQLNNSNAPTPGNITIADPTNTSWTDTTANQSTQRYYALAAYSGSSVNLTTTRMGKFDLTIGSGEDIFSIPLDETRPIGQFMDNIGAGGPTILSYSGGWLMTFWDGAAWDSSFGFPNLTIDTGYLTTGFTAARNITNINAVPTGNTTTSILAGEGTFGWNSITTNGDLTGGALLNMTGEAGGPTILTYNGGWLMTFWDGAAWDDSFGFATFQAGNGYLTTGFVNPANMTYNRNQVS